MEHICKRKKRNTNTSKRKSNLCSITIEQNKNENYN